MLRGGDSGLATDLQSIAAALESRRVGGASTLALVQFAGSRRTLVRPVLGWIAPALLLTLWRLPIPTRRLEACQCQHGCIQAIIWWRVQVAVPQRLRHPAGATST